MRMGVQACVLAAMALASGWIPALARAEGFGGPCGGIAPGAILPLPVHFNATTGSPYTPNEVEFTDSEPLPLSNFSATANWGDGTTTPAMISPEGCHLVTAAGHAYTHSGAYSFSYTVHDAHTGLDHEIGAEIIYIWGVPQRVDDPSSHVIDATVDIPWSGILGEFTEEALPFEGAPYYAHIEWEEGDRTWAPANIAAGEDGRLVVTATHTFPAEFSGNTTVHVGITEAEATWPVSADVHVAQAEAPSPNHAFPNYEFRGRQILAATPSVKGSTAYEIVFRLNVPLPATKSGSVEASLGVGIAGSISRFGHRAASACYAVRLVADRERKLKSRRSLPFNLKIQQPASAIPGKAVLHKYASLKRMHSAASRQLSCA
jgi:PKD repeat protein